MKKTFTIFIALLLFVCANSQNLNFSMVTTIPVGNTIEFSLQATSSNTPIQVDFGDGVLVDYLIGDTYTKISNTIVNAQTINIYGTGITHINCNNIKLTNLDVSNNSELIELYSKNNLLTTLDLSNNTAL